jgi:hypothetical protein
MSFTINKDEHIKYIVDNFNFNKVYNVMKFVDWKWYNTKSQGMDVPTINDMKTVVIQLLNNVYIEDDDVFAMTSGGFRASKYEDHLELEFILNTISSDAINDGVKYERYKKNKNRVKKLNKIEDDKDN